MTKKFSATEAASYGWEKVKENLGFFVLLSLVLGTVTVVVQGLTGFVEPDKFLPFIIAQLISTSVSGIIALGVANINLNVIRGKEPNADQFFDALGKFVNWLVATIVMIIVVLIGFILLVVPGLILSIKLQFYTYYIVEKDLSPIDSLKASWDDTKGQFGELFIWGLISLAIMILGVLAFVVGLLVALPVVALGTAWIYVQITSGDAATAVIGPTGNDISEGVDSEHTSNG